jgi:hypothetical protein
MKTLRMAFLMAKGHRKFLFYFSFFCLFCIKVTSCKRWKNSTKIKLLNYKNDDDDDDDDLYTSLSPEEDDDVMMLSRIKSTLHLKMDFATSNRIRKLKKIKFQMNSFILKCRNLLRFSINVMTNRFL